MGKNPEGKFDTWLRGEEDRLDSERMCGSFGGGLRRRLAEAILEDESMWGSLELVMVEEEGGNGGGGGGWRKGEGDGKTRGGG